MICISANYLLQEINPRTPEIEIPKEGTNVTIEYYVYELEVIYKLIERSRYYTQELMLNCVDSGLELGGTFGWYSKDGEVQHSWAESQEGDVFSVDILKDLLLEPLRVRFQD